MKPVTLLLDALRLVAIGVFILAAYDIRLYAINKYGRVIHEFDPWFNYRATEYYAANGLTKFLTWYDHTVWYPLGRPVGTTIYPGMQVISVFIWRTLNSFGIDMSLNDVCCFVPCWFGSVASVLLGLLTYETTGSKNAGVFACGIMAVIPGHLMRSVGGGFDNESVAITFMISTFYLWVLSLRGNEKIHAGKRTNAWVFGILTGLSYFVMVATWGGYVYVLNLITFHCGLLVLFGHYTSNLHKAFSLFYVIGTSLAIQVPVVGWTPLKSLEQLGAFAMFGFLQLMALCEHLSKGGGRKEKLAIRKKVFGLAGVVAIVVSMYLGQRGYFGPISSRIRSLFVQHTRTGNPLVDSVAEHQPTSSGAYWQYLHIGCMLFPIATLLLVLTYRTSASYFLVAYIGTAYYFSSKMARLVLLMAPPTSALSGFLVSKIFEWSVKQITSYISGSPTKKTEEEKTSNSSKKKEKKKRAVRSATQSMFGSILEVYEENKTGRLGVAIFALFFMYLLGTNFYTYCRFMRTRLSHPSIMYEARLGNGQTIMVDDYREAYWWLRDKTPEDSRVMAWWDYGYQINGIGNRTTIADGNTWNHEHIATLGRCLTSPVKRAHKIIRHLADYVLVWTGGGGDDLAKSPHMARIGNSVFRDICPNDPTCSKYGFLDRQMTPTPMMAKSLLYKLTGHKITPGVRVDERLFKPVFKSKYNKVRIYKVMKVSQESKAWVADPANRVCDAPGSWYCTGQYPPAIMDVINKRHNFRQLEDFNAEDDEFSKKYTEEYMKRMAGGGGMTQEDVSSVKKTKTKKKKKKKRTPTKPPKGVIFEDTDDTTNMYALIRTANVERLDMWIDANPSVIHIRSSDGRGPLWWAYEFGNQEVIDLLIQAGADEKAVDVHGNYPKDIAK